MERPAFELRSVNDAFHIRIYANGRVEGADFLPGRYVVFNRIPLLIAEAQQRSAAKAEVETP